MKAALTAAFRLRPAYTVRARKGKGEAHQFSAHSVGAQTCPATVFKSARVTSGPGIVLEIMAVVLVYRILVAAILVAYGIIRYSQETLTPHG